MEEPSRLSFRNGRLASRKAEEAAHRRFQAATWLEKMAGPLGLPSQPSEQEFVSCLKSGLVLCNAINNIQPGAVPKVVTNQPLGLIWENQTLPAYQYFENIRNFLVAIDELKIPSFEASDIERDTMEAGSVGRIVDCILGLKAYHDWKQFSNGNGPWKYVKSPMVSHTKSGVHSNMPALSSSVRCLDLSAAKPVSSINLQNCSFCLGKASCNHRHLLDSQEIELELTIVGSKCGQLGEVATTTPVTKQSSNTFSSSKGSSHLRKSLQTIGKLINGSEKRNYQVPSVVIPPKQDKDLHAVKKSPATVESRYKRRQSLTNVQPFESKGSRRSSLGGKAVVESYPTVEGIPGPKTPPAQSTNRWL